MKKKFSASEITQEVSCEWREDGGYEVIRNVPGEGFRRSLARRYMENLKEYVEHAGDEVMSQRRLLFLADDRALARQGYLICLKELAAREQEVCEEDEDCLTLEDGTVWNPLVWIKDPEEELDSAGMVEDILLVSEQDAVQDMDMGALSVEFMGFSLKGQSRVQERSQYIEKAENVLIELGTAEGSEQVIRGILKFENPNVAVWLKPVGDYKYYCRRLSFEGGYRVISLDGMEKEDYMECGREYLAYHHFEAGEDALAGMMEELMVFRGANLCEEDVYLHLDRCMRAALKRGKRLLGQKDLALRYDGADRESSAEWERVTGLGQVKAELDRQIAAAKVLNGRRVRLYGHIILEGPSGTGKSKIARLYAKRLAEQGLANGKFVDAVKADVVGRYVGQTAHLIKGLFRRAEGGVLFLDEASFLLADDQFVREAVVELVRYMELYPQTTVIFATYPKEGRKLLHCDPGFPSRISRVLSFESYSDQELWEILLDMAQDYEFAVEDQARRELERYIERIRHRKDFGNAREVRKLLEASIAEFGMRTGGGVGNGSAKNALRILGAEDLRLAGEYLLRQAGEDEEKFGFAG